MLDLQSLKLFIQAADQGSLSKAAQQTNLALASASRRIALLEAHYGVPLFDRSNRGVQVTPAGQELLEHGRELLERERQIKAELADYANGVRGTVALYASPSAISQFLAQDLGRYASICPDVRIDLTEAHSPEILTALRDGQAEVGVIVAGPPLGGIAAEPYRRDRLAVVVRQDFPSRKREAYFAEFTDQDFVVFEAGLAIQKIPFAIASRAGPPLRLRINRGSFAAACHLIAAGFGVGVLPKYAAMNFEQSLGLRHIELKDDWAERQMLICTNAHQSLGTAAKRLVALLQDAEGDKAAI